MQYKDVVIDASTGEVVQDHGVPGTEKEENLPLGIAPGMEKYLPEQAKPVVEKKVERLASAL